MELKSSSIGDSDFLKLQLQVGNIGERRNWESGRAVRHMADAKAGFQASVPSCPYYRCLQYKGTQGETTDDNFYFMILSHNYPPKAAKTL